MLYPIELRAPTSRGNRHSGAVWSEREHVVSGHEPPFRRHGNYPRPERASSQSAFARPETCAAVRIISRKNPQRVHRALRVNGRYKTRTCDLHDVNVAL